MDAKREGVVSGARSVRRPYSVYTRHSQRGAGHKGTIYLCNTKEVLYPGPEFFTCNDTVQRFGAVDDSLGMRF